MLPHIHHLPLVLGLMAFCGLCTALLVLLFLKDSPEGFEDESGFHYGTADRPLPLPRRTGVSANMPTGDLAATGR